MNKLPVFAPRQGPWVRVYRCVACDHTTESYVDVQPCILCGSTRYEKRVARRRFYTWWQRWLAYPLALHRAAPEDDWEVQKTGWGLL